MYVSGDKATGLPLPPSLPPSLSLPATVTRQGETEEWKAEYDETELCRTMEWQIDDMVWYCIIIGNADSIVGYLYSILSKRSVSAPMP
jgi:hypothetical protein